MKKSVEDTFVLVKVIQSVGGSWTFSTYVLFLTGLGLPLYQVNILNFVYMSISSVLDPFTGNLGDRWGQKKIYMAGLLFWGLAMSLYGKANIFLICAVAEAVAAVGHAMMSEALESWLRNHCDEKCTHEAMSKSQFWAKIATIPSALLGGLIGSKFGYQWPWILAGVTSFVALGVVWVQLRKWPEKPDDYEEGEEDLRLWTIALNAWKDPILRRSFIAVAILFAAFQPFNMFWQVIFAQASGDASWMGSVWMGIAVTSAFGGWLAKKWKVSSKGLAFIVAMIGLPMLVPSIEGNWIVLILAPFLFHEVGRSMWLPVLFSYTNKRISSRTRTSVNSLRSSAGSLGAAVGLLVSGWLTTVMSPIHVWGVSAAMLILMSVWIWKWNHEV